MTGYLFNSESERGWAKGEWFRRALGFEAANEKHLAMLEQQIKFNPQSAAPISESEWGPRWRQDTEITGPNGKTIDGVRVIWQKDKGSGIMRVITIMPPK